MSRDALNLAQELYEQPNLRVSDVKPTKLIDFENIGLRFWVNIRLYESINQLVWKLVFGHLYHRSSLPNIDISLCEGHCFYIKDFDVLVNHWECMECQQRFTCHNNYERHVTKKQYTSGQLKLICNDGKFKRIMNNSEKVLYGEIHSSHGKLAGGLSASLSGLVGTSITHRVRLITTVEKIFTCCLVNLNIRSGTVGYNNKILVSDGIYV